MHAWLHLLTIGVATNLDNLAVGVAYGIRRIWIPTASNLAIAAIAFVFSVVSAVAGTYVGRFMSASTANLVGAALMIGIGIWVLPRRRRADAAPSAPDAANDGSHDHGGKVETAPTHPSPIRVLHAPELADSDHSGVISLGESLVLGVAVSINCLTNGLPAGLWKLQPLPVATCNAVLSFVTLWCGVWLGKRYGEHWLGRKADWIAAVLLILLGVRQAFGS